MCVYLCALQTLEKLFSRDWARACGKEKFTSMLSRENKGNAAGKSDKAAMQEVHDTLKKHYQVRAMPQSGCRATGRPCNTNRCYQSVVPADTHPPTALLSITAVAGT